MKKEKWLPIKGYEKRYKISSHGNIKSLLTGKLMSQLNTTNGYLSIGLTNGLISKRVRIHILVAQHFIPNNDPKTKNIVDHIDGNKKK